MSDTDGESDSRVDDQPLPEASAIIKFFFVHLLLFYSLISVNFIVWKISVRIEWCRGIDYS